MKEIITLFLPILCVQLGIQAQCTADVYIPDANFKAALIADTSINIVGDADISYGEAVTFTGKVDVGNKSITDLTGIEAFINITELECDNNTITSLDLSNNTLLEALNCSSTGLIGLDLSNNSELTYFICTSTSLESLNIANGNNENISPFFAIQNPVLSCIQVDDVTYSTTEWIFKDATSSFSVDCSATLVPKTTTRIEEERKAIAYTNMVSVYPNPVENTLHIRLQTGEALEQGEVYNLSGKKIMTSKENITDVASLAS